MLIAKFSSLRLRLMWEEELVHLIVKEGYSSQDDMLT